MSGNITQGAAGPRAFWVAAPVGLLVAAEIGCEPVLRILGLNDADRALLLTVPQAWRGGQPVFVPLGQKDNQNKYLLTNPALRQSLYSDIEIVCLVQSRLYAALGLVATETAQKKIESSRG